MRHKPNEHAPSEERAHHEGATSCFLALVANADVEGQWVPSHLIPDHAAEARAMSNGRFRGCT